MDTLNHVVPSSLFGAVRRVWVDDYWYEAEVWGSDRDASGNTMNRKVWSGSCQYRYYDDARQEADNMCRILNEVIEENS